MKGIHNCEQVNEEYGIKLSEDEFKDVLVPAWLSVIDGKPKTPMTDDEFVKWFKKSKTNRLIAGALAKMWSKCFYLKQDLHDAKNNLFCIALDDFLIDQLNETERFIEQARAVIKIVKAAKQAEREAKP
ncbi:MAG: hypothetical protein IJT68_07045 [Lentisphaeria bacterium]|nr:hypothetical protein [Lentisphaeria bacterium]